MASGRLSRLTAPPVLRIFAASLLLLSVLGLAFQYATHRERVWHDDVVAGRDFLAFYGAGRIVLEGEGARLYDFALQKRVQDEILAPQAFDGLLPFVNPASLAPLYAALATLPYEAAFALHAAGMALLFLLGVRVLLGQLPALGPHAGTVALLGLAWLPMLLAVASGQNGAASFALLAVAYAALRSGREAAAGVALGLLLFKPQYALPFAGLLLLRRRWRAVGGFGAVAGLSYLAGALACGWSWPLRMFEALQGPFRSGERVANGARHIALPEVLDYGLVLRFEGHPASAWLAPLATGLAVAAVVAGIALLIFAWRRARPERDDFALQWALVVPVMLLIGPHAQFYEIALLLLPVLLLVDHRLARGRPLGGVERLALVAGYFVLPLHQTAPALGFQPLVLVPAALAAWIGWELRDPARLRPRPDRLDRAALRAGA